MAPEDGHDDGEANQKTVFVDTSLDTYIATIISDSDTVSDLKNKLILEHRQCFPAIGDIEIHSLKVKRRGNYYHLSDSMLVKSAWGSSKKVRFLSADASRVQQCDELRHSDRHKAGDQLALPRAADCRSTDRHESPSGRPLKLSFVHGSPSMHPKMVPFVNQKTPSDQFTSGDSCKDIPKNIEEDRSFNEDHCRNLEPASGQQLYSKVEKRMHTVNKEMNSKKRIGDVRDESFLEDAFGPGPSVKKKRKTQRTVSNVKGSEEDIVLTYDTDKVKNKGTNINDENSIRHKSKSKDATLDGVVLNALSDEHTENTVIGKKMLNRVKEGGNLSGSDPVVAVASSTGDDFGEKTHPQENTEAGEAMPNVAVDMEKNVQLEMPFEMSQKEKENELAQKEIFGKIPSSSTRTTDCDQDAPGVTAVGRRKGAKRSTKQKTAEKEASSPPFIKELHKAQDLGSHGQEFTVDSIDKCKEDGVTVSSLNQGPEVKLSERSMETTVCETTGASKGKRKKSKKSTAENENELLVKHVDNLVDDIPITIPSPPFDEKNVNEDVGLETSSKLFIEKLHNSNKDAVDQAQQDLGSLGQEVTGVQIDKCKEDGASKRKKKKSKKSTVENEDKLPVKHADNRVGGIPITVPSLCNVEKNFNEGNNEVLVKTVVENSLPHASEKGDDLVVKDVENSEPIENNGSGVLVEGMVENASKERKKKSGSRNDKSVVRHANEETLLPHSENKESLEQEDGLHADLGRNDVNLVENAIEIPRTDENKSQVDAEGIEDNLKRQNEKRVDTKKSKSKKKKKKPFVGNENANEGDVPKETLIYVSEVGVNTDDGKPKGKDEHSFEDGLLREAKNHKFSTRGHSDLPSKHQSAEVELEVEPEKTEETLKSVSEVFKAKMKGRDDVNNEVGTAKDGSHEINFMNYFVEKVKDVQQSGREKKTKKKLKENHPRVENPSNPREKLVSRDDKWNREQDGSRNDGKENDEVLFSKNKTPEVSAEVVKDPVIPNTNEINTLESLKNTDVSKTNKSENVNNVHGVPSAESSSSSEPFGNDQKRNNHESITGRVKTLKKSAQNVDSSQHAKSSLNAGTIFGQDSDKSDSDDNAAANSDSSTRTPSGKLWSSSSEETSSTDTRRRGSHGIKRKEGDGKNRINSQSRLKNISMTDLLRSSTRFKKAKLTASQHMEDLESEPVDFVPESQLMDMS